MIWRKPTLDAPKSILLSEESRIRNEGHRTISTKLYKSYPLTRGMDLAEPANCGKGKQEDGLHGEEEGWIDREFTGS